MLKVIGLSHHTAPLEVRERFVFDGAEAAHALATLTQANDTEAVLLSTCNRTELYLWLPEQASTDAGVAALAEHASITVDEARPYLYGFEGRGTVEHLFRVVTSLDSMILGEPQIQGQVKAAYERAVTAGNGGKVVGPMLSRLFQQALAVGGRVRSETTLGSGAASIPSAAVELARKIFGSLRGLTAMVIGAGEMAELSLECLLDEGARSTVVASRSEERARALAKRIGSGFARFEEFHGMLPTADILVSATAAPHAVITRELVQRSLPEGPDRPLLIVDIALPRDVDKDVGDMPNVFLYDIDDLRQIVDDNLERRQKEIPKAERIVQGAVDDFWAWLSARDVVPLIRELRGRAERVRAAELERAMRRLRHLPPEDQAAVEALTRQLLNKVLHTPTTRLREAASGNQALDVMDAARYLFELDRQHSDRDDGTE